MDDKRIIDCPPYKSCRLEHEKEGLCVGECGIKKLRKIAAWRFGDENTIHCINNNNCGTNDNGRDDTAALKP